MCASATASPCRPPRSPSGRHPAVATVLVGAREPAEVARNAELLSRPMPDELWSELKAERLRADAPT